MVSFVNATLVLSIGETVEEVTDSGFLGTTPTLACSQLGDDALVQVGICGDKTLSGERKGCDSILVIKVDTGCEVERQEASIMD